MLEAKGANQEQLALDSLQLDGICICCEALTKLLVQKGIISWDELLVVARWQLLKGRSEERVN